MKLLGFDHAQTLFKFKLIQWTWKTNGSEIKSHKSVNKYKTSIIDSMYTTLQMQIIKILNFTREMMCEKELNNDINFREIIYLPKNTHTTLQKITMLLKIRN